MSNDGRRNVGLEHKFEPLQDRFGRVARKLRVSVTDRATFGATFACLLSPFGCPSRKF